MKYYPGKPNDLVLKDGNADGFYLHVSDYRGEYLVQCEFCHEEFELSSSHNDPVTCPGCNKKLMYPPWASW